MSLLESKLLMKGVVKIEEHDIDGNLVDVQHSENFMTRTMSRLLSEAISGFMKDFDTADRPSFGGFSAMRVNNPQYDTKAVKFAIQCTDNTLPIAPADEVKLRELPGNTIAVTRGRKSTYTDAESTITNIKLLTGGGIEVTAKIGTDVVGSIGTIGLVIPSDFNFNTDGSDKLYKAPVGELMIDGKMRDLGATPTNFVKFNNKIYFIFYSNYQLHLGCYDNGVITIQENLIYTGNSSYPTLQVVGDELWVIFGYSSIPSGGEGIRVYDTNLQFLRNENPHEQVNFTLDNWHKGLIFVNGGYLYSVYNLDVNANTFQIYKGKLQSAGAYEATVVSTVSYTCPDNDVLNLLYGSHLTGTTVMASTGEQVDLEALIITPTFSGLTGYPKVSTDIPKGAIKPTVIDGVVYCLTSYSHEINTVTGLSNSTTLVPSLTQSIYYPDQQFYAVKCIGGSALTCDVLPEVKNKTATNKLTITYTLS